MTLSQPPAIPETDGALDRLNAVERDLLGLLGRGHTAKSIAGLRSMSVLAVNERFRSARRKTGIASSREIARLLVARENRHDFIGLAEPAAPTAQLPRPTAHNAWPNRWRLLMAAGILIAAAMFAQETATPPERPLPPAVVAMFTPPEPAPDIVALHAEIATGPADPGWSRAMEADLSRLYHQTTDPSGALASLDVTCNASLCEIIGVSRDGLDGGQITALMDAVQSRAKNEAVVALKLDNIVSGFHSTAEGETAHVAATVVFAAYWRRRTD